MHFFVPFNKKRRNRQIVWFFCCNILITRQLTTWQLSANCLDGLLRLGELSDAGNPDERNCMCRQNP